MVIVKQLQNLEQSYKLDLGFSSAELKLYDDSINHNIFGMLTIQFAEMCVIIIFHCHNIFRRGTSMEKNLLSGQVNYQKNVTRLIQHP